MNDYSRVNEGADAEDIYQNLLKEGEKPRQCGAQEAINSDPLDKMENISKHIQLNVYGITA